MREAEAVMDDYERSGNACTDVCLSYCISLAGETIDEISQLLAAGMRAHCIKLLHNLDVLVKSWVPAETVLIPSNISTTSSLVIAAGGVQLQNMETGQHPPNRCSRCSGSTGSEDCH